MYETLAELIAKSDKSTVMGDIFDEATQDDIIFYFQDWETQPNFSHFIQRKQKLVKNQYLNLLRLETIKFDPMVTDYIERQIYNENSDQLQKNLSSSEEGNGSITRTGSDTVVKDGNNMHTGVDSITYGRKDTLSGTDTTTYNSADTKSGTDTTTYNNVKDTQSGTDTTTYGRKDTTTKNFSTGTGTKTKGFAAQVPPTGDPGSIESWAGGLDSGTSGAFSEGVTTKTLNRADSEVSETGNGNVQASGSDSTEHGLTNTRSGSESFQHGESINYSGTDSVGYGKASTLSGTDQNSYNSGNKLDETDTTTYNNTIENESSKEKVSLEEQVKNNTNLTQAIHTGRHEEASQLLGHARDYIYNTNAFKWLIGELTTCFIDIIDY